ncbi:hypothetical protein G4B88_031093 [Cannabis sativa]|uniref:NAC domain-containing protein n=1 Tax=Cannabis sativa TaxID=3483 RepID=A0A7J6GT67_CANSA|nr:hypothetical protein G4B88_031093 [Cannabis sativa]
MEFNNFLPAGVIFRPNDQEIIEFYVSNKNFNPHLLQPNHIQDVNIYDFHPQELADQYSPMCENAWYFFHRKDSSSTFKNSKRSKRKAKNGTWHGNAQKKAILNKQKVEIGFRRTLDFMDTDKKLTRWKMIEYRLPESNNTQQCSWVLCKIYKMKSKEKKVIVINEHKESNVKRQKIVYENTLSESTSNLYLLDGIGEEKNIAVQQEVPKTSTKLTKDELESIFGEFENFSKDQTFQAELDLIFQNNVVC